MEGKRDYAKPGSPYWYGEDAGMIPRSINQIFSYLERSHGEYQVRVSYLELYNEELNDLLSSDDSTSLRILDTSNRGIEVQNLEEVIVESAEDIFSVLERSSCKRQVAETNLNKQSSRSHSIFTIIIHM